MEHRGHRVSVQADTRAILQVPLTSLAISGASVVFADRHRLRETTSGLRASRLLLIAGILVTPFMIMGYLGLAVFLCVPLVGLRWMFPRPYRPSRLRPDGNAPLYPGVGYPWDAARRTA